MVQIYAEHQTDSEEPFQYPVMRYSFINVLKCSALFIYLHKAPASI